MKGAWSLRLGLLATSSPAFEDHLISACRVFRTPSGPPGASLCAAPPRPRGLGAGTRRETSLSNLRRHRGCTLGEMNYRGMNYLDPAI